MTTQIEIFKWSDFNNDIHIGAVNLPKDYIYKDGRTKNEYYKEWYKTSPKAYKKVKKETPV